MSSYYTHILIFPQVANKKQRDTAAQDAEMAKKKQPVGGASDEENADTASADILGDQEDEDVIF